MHQQMPNMPQFTDFVGICVAWKNLQDTTPNVESVCSCLFYCLLVLPMLYINYNTLINLIYVLSLLEVQTIHLAQGLHSYCGLIPHLAEGTMATMLKDGCKANPGCTLSIWPPMDISSVLTSIFLIPTLQNHKIGSLEWSVQQVAHLCDCMLGWGSPFFLFSFPFLFFFFSTQTLVSSQFF